MRPLPRAKALMGREADAVRVPLSTPTPQTQRLGILMLLGSVMLFTMMDALGKHLTQSYHPAQVIWMRMAINLAIVLAVLAPVVVPANAAVAEMRVETPDWSSTYRSSWVRYAGLMFTRIAPIFAVAYWTIVHSGQFGAQMPTRSPADTPFAMKPRATASTSVSSSR